jgi:hypothetical protein
MLLTLAGAVGLGCDCGDSGNDCADDCTADDDSGVDDTADDDIADDDIADDDIADDDTADDDTAADDDVEQTTWTDTTAGLMWQNGSDVGTVYSTWDEAKTYCADLSWDGYDDWRLPTVSELRSLIRGCAGTVTGGECGVTDDCLDYAECLNDGCSGCSYLEGPGLNGEYWPTEILGLPDRYCSSSPVLEADDLHAWYVHFGAAEVYRNGIEDHAGVRCVRDLP